MVTPRKPIELHKPSGRPTDYREEYNEMAFDYCLLGATDEELATRFNTSIQTLNSWKEKFPKFLESLKAGKDEADAKVAKSLYRKALEGDNTACIFWLKNRQSKKWRDKQEQEISTNQPIQITFKEADKSNS